MKDEFEQDDVITFLVTVRITLNNNGEGMKTTQRRLTSIGGDNSGELYVVKDMSLPLPRDQIQISHQSRRKYK